MKSNRKLYLILGGIAVVVLIAASSIVAVAIGIYYFSGPRTTFEGIPNTNSSTTSANSEMNTASRPKSLKEFVEMNSKSMAEFKLVQVETNTEKKWFPSSKDEALATFSSDPNDRAEIVMSLSSFTNSADAKKDTEGVRKNILNGKMKIVSQKALASGLVVHYVGEKAFGIMDCRERMCTSLSGLKKEKVERFYKILSRAR